MGHLSFFRSIGTPLHTPVSMAVLALPLIFLSSTSQGQTREQEIAASTAESGKSQPVPGLDHPSWTLRLEPMAWYASFAGDLEMPGNPGTAQNAFDLENFDLDEPRFAPVGFVHIQFDKWRFSVGGVFVSADDREGSVDQGGTLGDLNLAAGDVTNSSIDFWSAEIQAAYRLIHKKMGTTQDGKDRVVFGLEPVVGVRMYSADVEIEALSGASSGLSTSGDDTFYEPIAGLKLEGEFAEAFTVDLQTNFGYGPWNDRESFSWDIMIGGAWRPIPNVGVRIGYRQLLFDLESGSGSETFHLDGSLAGLMLGVEVRF